MNAGPGFVPPSPDPRAALEEALPGFRAQLAEFLAIPSVSAQRERDPSTRAAAEWVASSLRDMGFTTSIEETPRHPVVLGEWRKAGSGAPTLLIYGHYDVQPPDPLPLWSSPPFEATVRGDRIVARGAADDKGQFFLHLKALEAHLRATGTLPLNVLVLAEGEEEIGSPNLPAFLERNLPRLRCDAVVISDSAMFAPGIPSLCISLRGLAYGEIHVRGAASDLHSGSYGGAVANPATALARIVATLHDEENRVTIPGFYENVREWDAETVERFRSLPFDEESFRREVGVPELDGEAGFTTLERLWTRPTCEVNGLLSGYTGEGAKTVLPAEAMAKISFRLVPDQDPERILDALESHLAARAPTGVTVSLKRLQAGRPWRGDPTGPLAESAALAFEEGFGAPPVPTGEGASIPIVDTFATLLGAPVLLMGFALPGANMHAPDEWFPLAHLERGPRTLIRLYEELGARLAPSEGRTP